MSMSRRELLQAGALLAAGGFGGSMAATAQDSKPAGPRGPGGPAAIGSRNIAPHLPLVLEILKKDGDPLDAAIAGVTEVENDPKDHSVGYGGLPNEDGVVELDAAVMHGPTHRTGAVAALQRIRNPARVAQTVLARTKHALLVGEGALRFARAHGFKEEDLLTDEAREIWIKWKESHSPDDNWLPPEADKEAALWRLPPEGPDFTYGTVHCSVLTAAGDLASVTSTSGLSYKLPGRVGDSPIIGAGLFTDNDVGSAGSTGFGEANIRNCSSFMIVESMRRGLTPEEACLEQMRRVAKKCEPRLRNEKGEPAFGLSFYAIRKDGLVGGAVLRGKGQMAYHDGREGKILDLPALYAGS